MPTRRDDAQRVHGMHNNPVDSPEHYQFGQLEAWDIIELAVMGIADPVTAYHVASALKYLLRAARKGGDTDIAKASAHLKRETARHVIAAPDYDPADVAFRAADQPQVDKVWDALGKADKAFSGEAGADLWRETRRDETASTTAAELAAADGCAEYGNPVTPGCAMPSADDKTHGVFDVDLTRPAFFHTTDGVYHAYARARWP